MATVITEECINCGACEPECPNTAIYQGDVEYEWQGATHVALSADLFYIVPEKCTECVGFFDQEACAAVCPVDCCVPDPERMEGEAALLDRARVLHPDETFGADFPSRFKKQGAPASGSESGTDAATPSATSTPSSASPPAAPPGPAAAPPPVAAPRAATSIADGDSAEQRTLTLEDHEVPLPCGACGTVYAVAYRYLTPGTVLRCPVCQASFSPTQRLYLAVGERLEAFADLMNAEIDRHENLIATESRRFQTNTERLRRTVDAEIAELAAELTEPRKSSIFG